MCRNGKKELIYSNVFKLNRVGNLTCSIKAIPRPIFRDVPTWKIHSIVCQKNTLFHRSKQQRILFETIFDTILNTTIITYVINDTVKTTTTKTRMITTTVIVEADSLVASL